MGQALEMCRACQTPRDCDTCIELNEWIMEHMQYRWISVHEKMMPLPCVRVLAVTDGEVCEAYLDYQYSWHRYNGSPIKDVLCEPTYWMPMPKPPKEVGDENA